MLLTRTMWFCFVACCVCMAGQLSAAETAAPDYETHVAPLLKKYCAGCHNDGDREGKLSLESYDAVQKGTPDRPVLLPGDSAGSRMIRALTGAIKPAMPPEGEPQPSKEEVALLAAWIDAGAKGPSGAAPNRLALHVPKIVPKPARRAITALDVSPQGMVALARGAEVDLFRRHPGEKLNDQVVRKIMDFPGKVTAIHFDSTGERLVTASGVAGLGGVAALWKLDGGSLIRQFEGHRDILNDAELSPDGKVLATCSYDKTIILWNVETGEKLRTLEGHNGAVYDVAFSPDSQFLVSSSADDTCKVWRVADGERMDTLSQPLKEEYVCLFTPDGKRIIAAGADNTLRVWDFISRDKPRINPMVVARYAHEAPIIRMALSTKGTYLFTAAEDKTIKAWNVSDFTQRAAWEHSSDVSAIAAFDEGVFVAGLEGSFEDFQVSASAPAPSTTEIATAAVKIPGSAALTPVNEVEPNNSPATAQQITLPAEVAGKIEGRPDGEADRDIYRFAATAGEEWVLEVNAARAGSKLDSFIEVLTPQGERLERVRLQAVKASYLTFRGKNAAEVGDFRVFNWEEMRLNDLLYLNGEVVKLWLYPRGPDSGYQVYPNQGNRWNYFDTTALAHPLGEPCYIVEPHAPGAAIVPNGLPVFPIYHENDDDAARQFGKDSRLYFTAPTTGEYLVKIKDVRGFEGAEYGYTLKVRPRQADFKVTLHNANPTVNAGSGKEFKVTAERFDGFEGAIRIDIDGLPPGFTATTPIVIEPEQIEAWGVLNARADAPALTAENSKSSKVTATAQINGVEQKRDVNSLGEIKLAERAKIMVVIEPLDGGAQPVAAPADGPLEFAIAPGETIRLQVRVVREGDDGNVLFGNEGSGKNLPFGAYVDNLGLNGLLVVEKTDVREFFVTADARVTPQTRPFFLSSGVQGGQASRPVILHFRQP